MGKLTVGCKLPHGIVLQVDEQKVALKGTATEFGVNTDYALTPDVDSDFFAAWMKDFSESAMVKNGAIFAEKDERSAAARSKEQREIKTGMEPVNPDDLAKITQNGEMKPFNGKSSSAE